ncbi:helix-turn-helix domain-containing protein [Streptomyces sp. NPDC001604]|uniref:nSTAND1 domain-containing NTPase n=1 Tax=Streptomyces sp. NPDC001604 TaxID=3364593 RepID=UPI0036D1E99D
MRLRTLSGLNAASTGEAGGWRGELSMAGRPESPLDPSAGPVARFAAELRKLRAEAGSPTYRVMAQRAGQGTSTLSQAAGGERLPTLPVVLAYVRACGGDPEEWEERWRQAAAEVAAEPRTEDEDVEPPYRGLARFEPGDADLFFGRGELTDRLAQLTRSRRFTAVFGPSGSGKSSLLRAGLIPRLRTPDQAGPQPAALRVLTPGEHPLRTHEQRLTPKDGDGDTWLIVDQFEELYTLCHDPVERDQFIDQLLTATNPGSGLRVVIAVRADFLGRCAEHPALTAALQDATVLAGPMSRDELREAITKPAQAAGMIVERSLTTRLIEEVSGEPGALPLLSHALLETWYRRNGRALTEAAYEAAGGLQGAIARTAEDTFGRLTPAQADLARHMLLRLITPGDGTPDTRRPTDRGELVSSAPDTARADADVVLERWARARLIILDDGAVDLAHETLISAWPRLSGWIDAERDRIRTHRQLTEAARAWQDLDRDPGALYRGNRLAIAQEAFAAPEQHAHLTPLEQSFLSAGLAARDRERQSAARSARRLRTFVVALSCLVVLALMAGLVAWQQNRAGERQRLQDEARRIAAVAESLRSSQPAIAMRLSLAAWKIAELPETRSALMGSMAQKEQDAFRIPDQAYGPEAFLDRDGRTAVSVSGERVTRWDVRSHRKLSAFSIPGVADTSSLPDVSPDGRILAFASAGSGIQFWDLATGKKTGQLPGHGENTVWFGPSGHTLAASALDGGTRSAARLWDLRHRRVVFKHSAGSGGGVSDAVTAWPAAMVESSTPGLNAVSPDDRLTAVCTDKQLEVWDVARHRQVPGAWKTAFRKGGCRMGIITFTPDSRKVAVASGNGLRTWDVAAGRELPQIKHHGLTDAEFSQDGRFVATADDNEIQLWRADAPTTPVFRIPWADGQDLGAIRLDLKAGVLRYATGSSSTTVWTVSLGHALDRAWQQDVTVSAGFSPDGRLLAQTRQAGGRHRMRLVDVPTGKVLTDRLPTAPCTTGEDGPQCSDVVSFASDSRTLAYSTMDDASDEPPWVKVLDTSHPNRPTTLRFPPTADDIETIDAIALAPGGRSLLVSLSGERTEVWDVRRRARSSRLPGVWGESLAVTDDDGVLATTQGDVVDLHSLAVTHRALMQGSPTLVAFSHDGGYLAGGDESGWVTLWGRHARQWLAEFPPESANAAADDTGSSIGVSAMAFSHDGGTLAVGTQDGSVRLWDVASRRPVGSAFSTPGGGVMALAFSQDDRTLYVSAQHMPVLTYSVDARRMATDVCRRVGSGLSRADWHRYIPDVPYAASC